MYRDIVQDDTWFPSNAASTCDGQERGGEGSPVWNSSPPLALAAVLLVECSLEVVLACGQPCALRWPEELCGPRLGSQHKLHAHIKLGL